MCIYIIYMYILYRFKVYHRYKIYVYTYTLYVCIQQLRKAGPIQRHFLFRWLLFMSRSIGLR